MNDATGTTRFAYDRTGRVVSVTEPDGGVIKARYDDAGNCNGLTYASGLKVDYRYNLNGRLTGMRDWALRAQSAR